MVVKPTTWTILVLETAARSFLVSVIELTARTLFVSVIELTARTLFVTVVEPTTWTVFILKTATWTVLVIELTARSFLVSVIELTTRTLFVAVVEFTAFTSRLIAKLSLFTLSFLITVTVGDSEGLALQELFLVFHGPPGARTLTSVSLFCHCNRCKYKWAAKVAKKIKKTLVF